MRVKIHFKGSAPSRETNHEGTTMEQALSEALKDLTEDESSLITAVYIFRPGSEQPTVAVEKSSPH